MSRILSTLSEKPVNMAKSFFASRPSEFSSAAKKFLERIQKEKTSSEMTVARVLVFSDLRVGSALQRAFKLRKKTSLTDALCRRGVACGGEACGGLTPHLGQKEMLFVVAVKDDETARKVEAVLGRPDHTLNLRPVLGPLPEHIPELKF